MTKIQYPSSQRFIEWTLMLVQDEANTCDFTKTSLSMMFFLELGKASDTIQTLTEENETLTEKNDTLVKENETLKEQLRLLQAHRFGKSSEQSKPDEPSLQELEKKTISVEGYQRRAKRSTRGKNTDLSELPHVQLIHDLAEHEKQCKECQSPLVLMGKEVAKKLEVLPLRLYVVEHVCFKYSCRCCETIKTGQKEKSAIPKAIAGDSLIAELLENKYQNHLPLYRQSAILATYKAPISDITLGNWVSCIGEALLPVYRALWIALLSARYLQVDETPIKLLKPDKQGYLWSYFAPHIGKGLVVFEAALTRSGDVAKNRLHLFNGLVQTDAYTGYQALRQREGIVPLGCLTHARRKFKDILKANGGKADIAADVMNQLKPLYELEERIRLYPFRVKKRMRQKIAHPLLKKLHQFLKRNQSKVPPQSNLGQAIAYTLKQWPYLVAYLRHGCANIDTNWVENQIRPIALGKKNWLFMGNEHSATIHALFYSLVLTCILNHLNPRVYLHYLISQVHHLRQKKIDPYLLLPHLINKDKVQAFSNQQLKLTKERLNLFQLSF